LLWKWNLHGSLESAQIAGCLCARVRPDRHLLQEAIGRFVAVGECDRERQSGRRRGQRNPLYQTGFTVETTLLALCRAGPVRTGREPNERKKQCN
jgi:hypothetical protein